MCSCIFVLVILSLPQQGNTPGRHWFARGSFFPVWGRCNFLILLLSADLNAVLPQSSQVVTAYLHLHVASESFYLSCLYFRICNPPTLISKGNRQPSFQGRCMQGRGRQRLLSIYYYCFYFVVFYLESWYNEVSSTRWVITPVCYQLLYAFSNGITILLFNFFFLLTWKFGPT